MAKQGQRAEVNTFIQGLITEASPLNFPPNASKEEENFVVFRDGTRRRRLGVDFVNGYTLRTISNTGTPQITNPAFNGYSWKDAGGFIGSNFIAAQVGNCLEFFDESFTFLQKIQLFPDNRGNHPYSFSSIEGRLIVMVSEKEPTNSDGQFPIAITFNGPGASPLFTEQAITLQIRDVWGVDTLDANLETDIYYRPVTLPGKHIYNLTNQSWALPRRDDTNTFQNPISIYAAANLVYPANSEVVWTGVQFSPAAPPNPPFEKIYPNLYPEVLGLQPLAAKGFYIIEAMARGFSRSVAYTRAYNNSGGLMSPPVIVGALPEDKTQGGATVAAGYAGRAWYAGFSGNNVDSDSRSPKLNSYILFSQLIRNFNDLGKCYQEGDPTSREGADIVDTDGGFIKIAEMDKALSLQPLGSNLIVIANNGVWAITGGSDYGFAATNYKVSRLSTYGCVARDSVILQGDSVMYWGEGGVYAVATDKTSGQLAVTNISKTTIQSFYDEIPASAISSVRGIYDDKQKKLRWTYKTGTPFTSTSSTKELIFDYDLGTFSLFTIKNSPVLNLEIQIPLFFKNEVHYLVYKNLGLPSGNQYTFANYKDTAFLDWKTNDGIGVDAKAFVLTGSQIAGDSAIFKQIPYIVIHLERTETGTDVDGNFLNQSGCLFRVSWDWAQDVITNKIGPLQQAYRYRKTFLTDPSLTINNGFEVVTTRNKVRGRGRALALYMETEPGKDCHILGWNITLNGNSVA